MGGRSGGSAPTTTPGSRSAWAWATAPAAHSASRRPNDRRPNDRRPNDRRPNDPDPNAPAVANASICGWVRPARRTTSSISAYGRPAANLPATSAPNVRTYDSPTRTANPDDAGDAHSSNVAVADEALMSGPRTTTP